MPVALKFTVEGREREALSLAFQGRLMEVIDEKMARLKKAYPRAMAIGVTTPGKAKLRATIEATGFYKAGALAKTWRGATYPRVAAGSLEPVAVFSSRAAVIINAFEDGVTVRVRNAQYLAVPQGPAKAIIHNLNRARGVLGGFSDEADPVERVAAALGTTLIPLIDHRRDLGVLVAASGLRLTRAGHMAKNQAGKPTVLFALVKQATLKQRPMGRQVLADLKASFLADFAGALAAELGPDA